MLGTDLYNTGGVSMGVLLQKRFAVSNGKVAFDFEVRTGLTLLCGDSGSGKTRFFSLYRKRCAYDRNDNIEFIDWQDNGNSIKNKLNAKGKVFIIDSADVVLTDDVANHIKNDKYNQYIILGRSLERYGATKRDVAIIVRSKDGVYKLWYYREDQQIRE